MSASTIPQKAKAAPMKYQSILKAQAEGRKLASAEIRAAIDEAAAALPSARAEADRIEKQRKASLLTASDEEMEKAERQVAERRRTAERIEVALDVLRGLLTTAEAQDAVQQVKELEEAFQQKLGALEGAWKKSYPGALATVKKLLALEAEAETAFRLWSLGQERWAKQADENQPPLAEATGFPSRPLGLSLLRRMVQMPDAQGRLCAEGAILPRSDEMLRCSGLERLESLEEQATSVRAGKAEFAEMMRRKEAAFDTPRENEVRRPRNGNYPVE